MRVDMSIGINGYAHVTGMMVDIHVDLRTRMCAERSVNLVCRRIFSNVFRNVHLHVCRDWHTLYRHVYGMALAFAYGSGWPMEKLSLFRPMTVHTCVEY